MLIWTPVTVAYCGRELGPQEQFPGNVTHFNLPVLGILPSISCFIQMSHLGESGWHVK